MVSTLGRLLLALAVALLVWTMDRHHWQSYANCQSSAAVKESR